MNPHVHALQISEYRFWVLCEGQHITVRWCTCGWRAVGCSRSGLIWLHRRATVSTVRVARELSFGEVDSLYIRSGLAPPAKIKITPPVLSPSHSPQLRPHAQYPYCYLASPLNQVRCPPPAAHPLQRANDFRHSPSFSSSGDAVC